MKILMVIFLTSFIFFGVCSAKSRIGEYILGFGSSMADSSSDDREGDFFRLTAHAPNNSNSDIGVYFDYGSLESGGTDASSWSLGVDYLATFNQRGSRALQLTPYLGAGVGYLDDEKPVRLGKDGMTWSLLLGTDIQLSPSLTLNLGGRYFGLWSEFGENEFTADAGLTWWFDHIHGISLEFQRAFDSLVDDAAPEERQGSHRGRA